MTVRVTAPVRGTVKPVTCALNPSRFTATAGDTSRSSAEILSPSTTMSGTATVHAAGVGASVAGSAADAADEPEAAAAGEPAGGGGAVAAVEADGLVEAGGVVEPGGAAGDTAGPDSSRRFTAPGLCS